MTTHKVTDITANGLAKVNIAKFGADGAVANDTPQYAILARVDGDDDSVALNTYVAMRIIFEPGTAPNYTALNDAEREEFARGFNAKPSFVPEGVWSFYKAGMIDGDSGVSKGGLAIGTLHVLVTKGHETFDTVESWVPKLPFDEAGYKNYLGVKTVEDAKKELLEKLGELEERVKGVLRA